MEILHIYLAPRHGYWHGGQPELAPITDVAEVRCLAGRGLEGDRFCRDDAEAVGQVTFFAQEVYEDLCARFGESEKGTDCFRRNVITRGVDLNTLIGEEFEVQGIRFRGTQECAPCPWMDETFHPGTKLALKGRGGLRAQILNDGLLRRTTGA